MASEAVAAPPGGLAATRGLSPGSERRTPGLLSSTSSSGPLGEAQMLVAELPRQDVLPDGLTKLPPTAEPWKGDAEAGSTFGRQREGQIGGLGGADQQILAPFLLPAFGKPSQTPKLTKRSPTKSAGDVSVRLGSGWGRACCNSQQARLHTCPKHRLGDRKRNTEGKKPQVNSSPAQKALCYSKNKKVPGRGD